MKKETKLKENRDQLAPNCLRHLLRYIFFKCWDVVQQPHFKMPDQSKCQQYSPTEINLESISNLAFEELGQIHFRWQVEETAAILSGNDVVLDVGTGCGKSLCFSLPLLSKSDISLMVSPLTALMIDQVSPSTKYSHSISYLHFERLALQKFQRWQFVKRCYLG